MLDVVLIYCCSSTTYSTIVLLLHITTTFYYYLQDGCVVVFLPPFQKRGVIVSRPSFVQTLLVMLLLWQHWQHVYPSFLVKSNHPMLSFEHYIHQKTFERNSLHDTTSEQQLRLGRTGAVETEEDALNKMASQQQTRMMSRGLLSNGGGEGLGLSCQGFEGREL